MSVSISYRGGIGNNLFQYIFARLFARRNKLALKTPFNHPEILSTTPHEPGEEVEGEPVTIHDYMADFTKPWAKKNYEILGYYQNADFYLPNRTEIEAFAKPVIGATPRPDGELVVNFRIGMDYRIVGIHPTWYQMILRWEHYDRLFVVADYHDPDYFRTALKGHAYTILEGDAVQHFQYLREFKRVIAANSTFTWWALFFGNATRTYLFQRWIKNPLSQLLNIPGAIPLDGYFIDDLPWRD